MYYRIKTITDYLATFFPRTNLTVSCVLMRTLAKHLRWSWNFLTFFVKYSILDIWQRSGLRHTRKVGPGTWELGSQNNQLEHGTGDPSFRFSTNSNNSSAIYSSVPHHIKTIKLHLQNIAFYDISV